MNARVFDADRARLNLRLSATNLSNRIEELGAGIQPIIFGAQRRHQEGSPAGSFFQRPYKFNDANGDGKLSLSEVTFDTDKFTAAYQPRGRTDYGHHPGDFPGNALPTNTQSVTADLTLFKYVTLNTLFERRAGMRQNNNTESFRCGTGFTRGGRGYPADRAGWLRSGVQSGCFTRRAGPLHRQPLPGTNAGYIEDAEFIKRREASLTLACRRHFHADSALGRCQPYAFGA